jgi:hypothetical protein
MTIDQIILGCIGSGVGIISYYLKQNLKDLNNNREKTTSIESRLSLIEQQTREEMKHLSEITNSKLEVVQNDLSHMNGNVNKLFEISQQNTLNIDRMVKIIDKHDEKFDKYDNNILDFFKKYQLVEK